MVGQEALDLADRLDRARLPVVLGGGDAHGIAQCVEVVGVEMEDGGGGRVVVVDGGVDGGVPGRLVVSPRFHLEPPVRAGSDGRHLHPVVRFDDA